MAHSWQLARLASIPSILSRPRRVENHQRQCQHGHISQWPNRIVPTHTASDGLGLTWRQDHSDILRPTLHFEVLQWSFGDQVHLGCQFPVQQILGLFVQRCCHRFPLVCTWCTTLHFNEPPGGPPSGRRHNGRSASLLKVG